MDVAQAEGHVDATLPGDEEVNVRARGRHVVQQEPDRLEVGRMGASDEERLLAGVDVPALAERFVQRDIDAVGREEDLPGGAAIGV